MNSEIKHSPFPFHKIAVAVGFSPRTEAIIAESARLQKLFNASIIFIHISEGKEEQLEYLSGIMQNFGFNETNHKVIWKEGDTVEKILEVCKEERVDLLVAGALEKESILKYFLGGISRTLCRKAKCSMLMLKEPDVISRPVKHIVVEGSDHPKTAVTIETAIYIGKKTNAEVVHVVQEHDMAKTALIRSDAFTDDEADDHKEKIQIEEVATLNHILACADCGTLRVQTERLEGKPGYVISNFARENKADLLVLNSPDTKLNLLDRVFPHDIEYALADLPCDLLIVHSKEETYDF
jgi:nucleotide-binding universal stress UspA family protein